MRQEWAQSDQEARDRENQRREREEEARKKQQKQNQENNNGQDQSKSETDIPSTLPPENLEEFPQKEKLPQPGQDNEPFAPLPTNSPTQKETRQVLIRKLKDEIKLLRDITNRTPAQQR